MIKIKITDINLPLDTDFNDLNGIAAKNIGCGESDIADVRIARKSVDARKKNNIHFCLSLIVSANLSERFRLKAKNCSLYTEREYKWREKTDYIQKNRPYIVGFGPCGMFAALTLARAGLKPVVIERGKDVDTRSLDVAEFWKGGKLNENSNVQFGEGGAGTFSDGKLTTGIKDIRCAAVLREFYKHGADKSVLYEAKPHIGTDVLKRIVKSIREEIISLGGEICFNSKLEDLVTENGRIKAALINGKTVDCESLILCCGHSARDTFSMLKRSGINMVKKPFSVGLRIEHLQSDINRALYGEYATHPALPPADYKLSAHLKNGRGVYTFCMCPGGSVINASSEEGGIAVNGMSESSRSGENANSAVLVGVEPSDFPGEDLLAGCFLQEKIEKAARKAANGAVPVDTAGHFVSNKPAVIGRVKPTVKPNWALCDLENIFPSFITESLKEGIKIFDGKIEGFADDEAVLTAPETRSSSPVRILRDEEGLSNVKGLYPAGEGAGYAGGIMSAAVDGIKAAEKVIDAYLMKN